MASENENNKSGMGVVEVGVGAAAAGAASYGALHMAAQKQLPELAAKITDTMKASTAEFVKLHPEPNWFDMLKSKSLPDVQAAQKVYMDARQVHVEKAVAPMVDKAWDYTNPLKKPIVAFKEAGISTKVGVVALGVAAALGAAYLVNNMRNGGAEAQKESHVQRLQRERAEASASTEHTR